MFGRLTYLCPLACVSMFSINAVNYCLHYFVPWLPERSAGALSRVDTKKTNRRHGPTPQILRTEIDVDTPTTLFWILTIKRDFKAHSLFGNRHFATQQRGFGTHSWIDHFRRNNLILGLFHFSQIDTFLRITTTLRLTHCLEIDLNRAKRDTEADSIRKSTIFHEKRDSRDHS